MNVARNEEPKKCHCNIDATLMNVIALHVRVWQTTYFDLRQNHQTFKGKGHFLIAIASSLSEVPTIPLLTTFLAIH